MTRDDVVDWFRGLELISLDFVRPVYSELGVCVELEETLRGIVRDSLLGRLSLDRKVVSVESLGNAEAAYTTWISPFLMAAARAMGLASVDRLRYWIMYTACTEHHNPWILYEELLSSWATSFRRNGADTIGFSADPRIIARKLEQICDVATERKFLAVGRTKFLTDWDLPRFKRLGLLEIPEGSDYFPYVDAIVLAIRMSRFQDFWRWLLTAVGVDDLARIAESASRLAGDTDVSFCPPSHLPAVGDAARRIG